jgi:DNA-binding MarR family transcriptional regulator
MPEIEQREVELLWEAYSAGLLIEVLVDFELERAGVRPSLYSFLGWIRTLQPVTPTTLAAETGLPPTTIRDYIRRLVEQGEIEKRPNPADGRSYELVLTPAGLARNDQGWPAIVAAFRRVARHLERPPAAHAAHAQDLLMALKRALAEVRAAGATDPVNDAGVRAHSP